MDIADLGRINNAIAFYIDDADGQLKFAMHFTTHRPSDFDLGILIHFVEDILMQSKRFNEGTEILKSIKNIEDETY